VSLSIPYHSKDKKMSFVLSRAFFTADTQSQH